MVVYCQQSQAVAYLLMVTKMVCILQGDAELQIASSVVVIYLRYHILNYNYLWLNPNYYPLQLHRFLDSNDYDY